MFRLGYVVLAVFLLAGSVVHAGRKADKTKLIADLCALDKKNEQLINSIERDFKKFSSKASRKDKTFKENFKLLAKVDKSIEKFLAKNVKEYKNSRPN